MSPAIDGEYVLYEDHCEAMKRIAAAPVADEREAFEAWARPQGWLMDWCDGAGTYFSTPTRMLWDGWRGATASRAALSAGEAQQGSREDTWERFAAWLVDHCEGQVITEEFLHVQLGKMLATEAFPAMSPTPPPA